MPREGVYCFAATAREIMPDVRFDAGYFSLFDIHESVGPGEMEKRGAERRGMAVRATRKPCLVFISLKA